MLSWRFWCRLSVETPWPTSVYIPNTDLCFFIIVVFSFQVTSNFVCITSICISADYVVYMWRYSPFVTLILNLKKK